MNWHVGVYTRGDVAASYNELVFASDTEAQGYAADLYARWTAVEKTVVLQTVKPVTHVFGAGGLITIQEAIDNLTTILEEMIDGGAHGARTEALKVKVREMRQSAGLYTTATR